MIDDFKITYVTKDITGNISHCGVKSYGVQNVSIIEKLIKENICSFFISDRGTKKRMYTRTSPNGTILLTTDPNGSNTDTLNFLPLFDRPFLRQLI
jgi:hypothetical protein